MKKPEIGIGAVVFRGDDVLMIRRGKPPRKGDWAIPGGRQELGETVAEGARREVQEETGVDCRIGGLIDVVDGISRDADGSIIYHYTLVDMWGEWLSGEAVAASDAMAACFMAPAEIAGLDLWPETLRVIDLARRLRRA
ncbi:MAG: NUDIX hydrolase [Minwuia sp.]|nr:NUDIX hydrolase [Minwuia sp.]